MCLGFRVSGFRVLGGLGFRCSEFRVWVRVSGFT